MGRVATPSVARIYPDVNAKLGPSWHEYGELAAIQSSVSSLLLFLPDNLQVQWGSQDHYEIVRKVGRGKYSEVRFFRLYAALVLTAFRSSRASISQMTKSVSSKC